jgi:hypothetical protein
MRTVISLRGTLCLADSTVTWGEVRPFLLHEEQRLEIEPQDDQTLGDLAQQEYKENALLSFFPLEGSRIEEVVLRSERPELFRIQAFDMPLDNLPAMAPTPRVSHPPVRSVPRLRPVPMRDARIRSYSRR